MNAQRDEFQTAVDTIEAQRVKLLLPPSVADELVNQFVDQSAGFDHLVARGLRGQHPHFAARCFGHGCQQRIELVRFAAEPEQ